MLVIGDSIAEIGQGEKGWCTLLQNNLRKTYGNSVSFTNVYMCGNASYAGYVRTMALNDDVAMTWRLSATVRTMVQMASLPTRENNSIDYKVDFALLKCEDKNKKKEKQAGRLDSSGDRAAKKLLLQRLAGHRGSGAGR